MAASGDRALCGWRKYITGEQDQPIAIAILALWPGVSHLVEHRSPLSDIDGFFRRGRRFEWLNAVYVVEV
jgi:hypothetical protein